MVFHELLDTPGEHGFTYAGGAGLLEGILSVPPHPHASYVAILGHPHSLQGGSMSNKVVTTIARVFKELAIPSLRFNFRGVGASAGSYDEGIGESEDMLLLARQYQEENPHVRIIFAGFSFGSYVAYRSAAQYEHDLLITIAPPVHHYNYQVFSPGPFPWLVLQGDNDDVVPLSVVLDFVHNSVGITLLRFSETGHFFHGKLIDLKVCLTGMIRQKLVAL